MEQIKVKGLHLNLHVFLRNFFFELHQSKNELNYLNYLRINNEYIYNLVNVRLLLTSLINISISSVVLFSFPESSVSANRSVRERFGA